MESLWCCSALFIFLALLVAVKILQSILNWIFPPKPKRYC